ncbi:TrbG/VirB9 family P-type conjugative transfer protein [Phenylobacterium sp. J426]|uniref:TrbG/VirB9 family P-type conjugative transfer protein n=1 Tax=Phenylobacterium sp. J426 TaxID=2898439 RepID=UPI002151424B|nr:TrbG/VirB9 family P-type conjugative transfer protein [Phenylobacterium sp. J426]
MRKLLAAAACAALAAAALPAAAADVPKPGQADPRMREVDYDPKEVVRIVGTFRTATQIIFGPGEEIQHVALGDTVSWEVAAESNILFIKPRERGTPTNLIVTTRRGRRAAQLHLRADDPHGPDHRQLAGHLLPGPLPLPRG